MASVGSEISLVSNPESIKHLEEHAKSVARHLNALGVKYAVVGGLAVAFRAVIRTTNDLDLAVVAENDAHVESIVQTLIGLGYRAETLLESDVSGGLMTVRMISVGEREIFIDLLFATTGIEKEVVGSSNLIEVFPGLTIPVASRSSLIALKVLSANTTTRTRDIDDLQHLLKNSKPDEVDTSRNLLHLITERGYNRDKDLLAELDKYIEQFEL